MVDRPSWAQGVDLDRPSAARVYDYYLGGSHNFAVDRELAEQVMRVFPDMPELAQANRAFLRRAVRYCIEQGIDQFVDIGSGIPTVGNVHEVAHAVDPRIAVAYVDMDPVAVVHSRTILADNDRAVVVHADVRDPESVLTHPDLLGMIDLNRPVAVLMVALLHFMSDADNPHGVIEAIQKAVAPGSFLVISHASYDSRPEESKRFEALYADTPNPMQFRSRAEVSDLFRGWPLVDPGVVTMPLWRPDPSEPLDGAEQYPGYAGVGRKADA